MALEVARFQIEHASVSSVPTCTPPCFVIEQRVCSRQEQPCAATAAVVAALPLLVRACVLFLALPGLERRYAPRAAVAAVCFWFLMRAADSSI